MRPISPTELSYKLAESTPYPHWELLELCTTCLIVYWLRAEDKAREIIEFAQKAGISIKEAQQHILIIDLQLGL